MRVTELDGAVNPFTEMEQVMMSICAQWLFDEGYEAVHAEKAVLNVPADTQCMVMCVQKESEDGPLVFPILIPLTDALAEHIKPTGLPIARLVKREEVTDERAEEGSDGPRQDSTGLPHP